MQLYQWYLVLVLLSSSSLMLTASYSFIHLHSCPICEAQYDYDFTIAVQLALDNLKWSNGSSLGKNYRTVGEGSHNIMEPDRVLPTIQSIPLQVRLNISIQLEKIHRGPSLVHMVQLVTGLLCSYQCNPRLPPSRGMYGAT